jgi:formylglycine-generating enzyme required for sulfatase activity/type II secretory pathway component PulC
MSIWFAKGFLAAVLAAIGSIVVVAGPVQGDIIKAPVTTVKRAIDIRPPVPDDMVLVKGGCFIMGDLSEAGDDDERPAHKVCVDDFYIGMVEVTQGRWKEIMGNNPSHFKRGDDYPVEGVSWYEVMEFIRRLNRKTGRRYRLPTEAEWEYAARSRGQKFDYPTANGKLSVNLANFYNKPVESFWTKTSPVGTFLPNQLGLYDMGGNVWEWCADWYGEEYYKVSERENPKGPAAGIFKVIRGGAWNSSPRELRVSYRYVASPFDRSNNIGFRLVLDPPTEFSRGWIGVAVGKVTGEIARNAGLESINGAVITGIADGAPAGEAGLMVGDIITEYNHIRIGDMNVLSRLIVLTPPGTEVPVKVIREGSEVELSMMVGRLERDSSLEGWTGIIGENITSDIAEGFGFDFSYGVLVTGVENGSPAGEAGIKRGDIIFGFNYKKIKNLEELQREINQVPPYTTLPVNLFRDHRKVGLSITVKKTMLSITPERLILDLLGIRTRNLLPPVAELQGIWDGGAVIVSETPEGTLGTAGEIKKGDIILEINNRRVFSVDDLASVLEGLGSGEKALILIKRGNRFIYLDHLQNSQSSTPSRGRGLPMQGRFD